MLCTGAVTWNSGGWYGFWGMGKMRPIKIFENEVVPANTTVSSDWFDLTTFQYFGLSSIVTDTDTGTETESIDLTYNTSVDEALLNATQTVFEDVATSTHYRADSLTLAPMPRIRFHATASGTDTTFSSYLVPAY